MAGNDDVNGYDAYAGLGAQYDVVLSGTGVAQSILAAALARAGKRVLHIDAHDYYGGLTSQPGRGWIMVRSASLDGDSIVRAMRAGEFYASSGVTLDEVQMGDEAYRVSIRAQPGETFVTRFVGTRIVDGTVGPVGEVLAEQEGLSALYEPKGDELYIRAVVTSSRVHPNPYAEGDREMAWGQPWVR